MEFEPEESSVKLGYNTYYCNRDIVITVMFDVLN